MTKTSYDEVPYASYPYRQTHPERLATVATLLGMSPPDPRNCRVLELGCAAGGNLIPMAERFPESQFLGIDLSSRQIADGRLLVAELGLKNIELRHMNILDVGPELGLFDYIITHGIYSWVPDEVQSKILDVCRQNLSPAGVAYVSYNVYPGWHMRGMIRDIMCYRAQRFEAPADRVRQARGLLDFLVHSSAGGDDNPYGMLLKNELNLLRQKEDHYLFHEHLEDHNVPVYFHQFAERAEQHGLQYLGEADFSVMSVRNFPPAVEAMLQSVASNHIEMEQYMDFVRNRMFRQTLLCHADTVLDRTIPPKRVLTMHVASSARPEHASINIRTNESVTFKSPQAVTTTSEPLVKAAFVQLGQTWPLSLPFAELLATARSRVGNEAVVVDTSHATADARRLAEPLLRCYATAQVELSVLPQSFTLTVSERPRASTLARRQASTSHTVTNRRHEMVQLQDLQRHVIQLLDGKRDRNSLLDELGERVKAGVLAVREDGVPVQDAKRVRQILEGAVGDSLTSLAQDALLVE